MAHIKETKDYLIKYKKYLELLKTKGFDYYIVHNFCSDFGPKDSRGFDYIMYNITPFDRIPFEYDPTDKSLNISLAELRWHVAYHVDDLAEIGDVFDKDKLCSYLALFSVSSEIEKAYAQLMGNGIMVAPSTSIQKGYGTLFDLLDKSKDRSVGLIDKCKRSCAYTVYQKERFLHVIDRNANLEAALIMKKVAEQAQDEDIVRTFDKLAKYFAAIGYHRNNKGCFDHTFRDIGLKKGLDVLKGDGDLPLEKRLEYGLSIPEETRKLVLKSSELK